MTNMDVEQYRTVSYTYLLQKYTEETQEQVKDKRKSKREEKQVREK